MNEIPGLRNPWNSRRPEVPQKPKHDEDDNQKFEHQRFLSERQRRASAPRMAQSKTLRCWASIHPASASTTDVSICRAGIVQYVVSSRCLSLFPTTVNPFRL